MFKSIFRLIFGLDKPKDNTPRETCSFKDCEEPAYNYEEIGNVKKHFCYEHYTNWDNTYPTPIRFADVCADYMLSSKELRSLIQPINSRIADSIPVLGYTIWIFPIFSKSVRGMVSDTKGMVENILLDLAASNKIPEGMYLISDYDESFHVCYS